MRDAREYATSFVLNGEMVVAGGFNNRAGWLDSVERRPSGSNNSWVVEREWDLPKGVMNLCAEAVDDTKFIVTGTVLYSVCSNAILSLNTLIICQVGVPSTPNTLVMCPSLTLSPRLGRPLLPWMLGRLHTAA